MIQRPLRLEREGDLGKFYYKNNSEPFETVNVNTYSKSDLEYLEIFYVGLDQLPESTESESNWVMNSESQFTDPQKIVTVEVQKVSTNKWVVQSTEQNIYKEFTGESRDPPLFYLYWVLRSNSPNLLAGLCLTQQVSRDVLSDVLEEDTISQLHNNQKYTIESVLDSELYPLQKEDQLKEKLGDVEEHPRITEYQKKHILENV
jgi:hypothetical protein